VAYRIGHRDIVVDVIQDAFIQVWQEAHSFDPNRGSVGLDLQRCMRSRLKVPISAALPARCGRSGFAGDLRRRQGMQHRIFRRKTRCDATWRRLAPKKRASVISAYVDGCTDRNVICDGFSAAEQQRTRGRAASVPS
jgi:hypothetical protein